MFAILALCFAGIVLGALQATRLQSVASADLARAAAVQRSVDRALALHVSMGSQLQSGQSTEGGGTANLLGFTRTRSVIPIVFMARAAAPTFSG